MPCRMFTSCIPMLPQLGSLLEGLDASPASFTSPTFEWPGEVQEACCLHGWACPGCALDNVLAGHFTTRQLKCKEIMYPSSDADGKAESVGGCTGQFMGKHTLHIYLNQCKKSSFLHRSQNYSKVHLCYAQAHSTSRCFYSKYLWSTPEARTN